MKTEPFTLDRAAQAEQVGTAFGKVGHESGFVTAVAPVGSCRPPHPALCPVQREPALPQSPMETVGRSGRWLAQGRAYQQAGRDKECVYLHSLFWPGYPRLWCLS